MSFLPPSSRRLAALATTLLAATLTASATCAQFTEATTGGTGVATASERDREFAAIPRDVDALEREFGLVKRVVKLVTPTVVHIEAALPPPFPRQLRQKK